MTRAVGMTICVLGVLLAVPTVAHAATTTITGGDAAGLQTAIDEAGPGDVIVLKNGVYQGAFTVMGKTDLTIRGGKNARLFEGAPDVLTISESTGITIQGISIREADDNGVLVVSSSDVRLTKLTITSSGDAGIVIGSGSDDVTVEKCSFLNIDNEAVLLTNTGTGTPTNCTIRRCKILVTDDYGVSIEGDGHLVEKLNIKTVDEAGIELDGATNCTVQKCKIADAAFGGVEEDSDCSDNVLSKIKIKDVSHEGVSSDGARTLLEKVSVKNAGGHGFELDGTDGQLLKCKSSGATDVGIRNLGNGYTLDGCKVKSSGDDGIRVSGFNNTIKNCKAKKSAENDLEDSSGSQTNVYENNKPSDPVFTN